MKTSTSMTSNAAVSSARKTGLATIRNGDLEALMSKTGLDGSANQGIVINHKNARQDIILPDRGAGMNYA